MLVLEHVRERVDGAAGNPGLPDLLDPLFGGVFRELPLKSRYQLLPVGDPAWVGGVSFVACEVFTTESFAQPGELGIVAGGDGDLFIRGGESLVWDYGGVGVAHAAFVFTGDEVFLGAVGEPGEGALEERGLYPGSLSGLRTAVQ